MNGKTFQAYGCAMRWIENPASVGLRNVRYADEATRRIRHTGWFLDDRCGETVRGVICQISGKDGADRYLAGYADPHNDGPLCIDVGTVWDYDEDAAVEADRIAERFAEDEREHNRQADAWWEYDSLGTEIAQHREDGRALFRQLPAALDEGIAKVIRAHIRSHAADIVQAVARRRELKTEFEGTPGWGV